MDIIRAIKDPNLFGPFFGNDLSSWVHWLVALKCVYGMPVRSADGRTLIQQCSGRDPSRMPPDGFRTALFLCGRRSGKSRAAAVIGAYEAALAGHERKLSPGEVGVVPVVSPTRHQSRIVRDYVRAIFTTPPLAGEIVNETQTGFELRSGVRIEILAGHWRTIRGYTLLAAIVDETAFFGLDSEDKVKSDDELIAAIQPGLATIGGKLICITSPYAKKGFCYRTFRNDYGNDASDILVWKSPSRTMNPTLPQSEVDRAIARDLARARSEYLAEFRDDVSDFIPRAVVESLVVRGRRIIPARDGVRYFAFVDPSGGRNDDAALAIGHRVGRVVVIDRLCRYAAPFNPYSVVNLMAAELRRYGLSRVRGDAYAAEWTARAFAAVGIGYGQSSKNKNALYRELLPRMFAREIELPDDGALVDQISSLERSTRSGGQDVIDHPVGGHDDLANAIAGVADCATTTIMVGALPTAAEREALRSY